jgi:hypothetical protein
MSDTTAQKLAQAAATLYLLTVPKSKNSPLRMLGPIHLRQMRLKVQPLALPEHAS